MEEIKGLKYAGMCVWACVCACVCVCVCVCVCLCLRVLIGMHCCMDQKCLLK